MVIVNDAQPPSGKETHASEDNVALGRLSLNQRPIPEGPNDSLDANRGEQGDLFRVANEGGDLGRMSSAVLEKTLEDAAPDVT